MLPISVYKNEPLLNFLEEKPYLSTDDEFILEEWAGDVEWIIDDFNLQLKSNPSKEDLDILLSYKEKLFKYKDVLEKDFGISLNDI